MRRSAAETREHVLKVAHELFYWNGIRATGVDRISAEAGVAPMTLYRLFPSKDDLVAAYLARAHDLYREWFDAAAERGGTDPAARILAVFEALVDQTDPSQCRGCPFLMALAEIPDRDHPGHQQAVRTKQWVRTRFGELAAPLGGDQLADHLTLLMEGVYASAQAMGTTGPAHQARTLAELLLTTR
ncbi:MAG TPA: TetR/AcrR family transcriptional regulator [Pseudonocardiaceae bacterium]|nr:TetR/AcrR family transcriptional regulator [Pseudonocardiaceae bacterium]